MPKTVTIIGGGVGGLSAAIYLARRGASVTLLEKNPRVGGKLNLWAVPHPNRPADRPFKFDTGPNLLTLPLIFQDLFAAAGEDVRNYLPIQRLDPIARFSWRDGTTFQLRANEEDRASEVRRIAPDDVEGFQRIFARGESIWNLSADAFLFHAPEQMLRGSGFSPLAGVKMLTTPFRIGMFANYARLIDRHIKSDFSNRAVSDDVFPGYRLTVHYHLNRHFAGHAYARSLEVPERLLLVPSQLHG